MKTTILFLMCVLFSFQSFGFTEKEESAAYKKISSCSKNSVKDRIKHLEYAKIFATDDNVSLDQVVEHYNGLSCLTYDYGMLKIAESISISSTDFSRVDLLTMASRLHLGLKGHARFPTGILLDTLDTVLGVVTKSASVDEAVETYLDIFSTVDWHNWYHTDEDNQYDYEESNSPRQAKEALSVYKKIWGV